MSSHCKIHNNYFDLSVNGIPACASPMLLTDILRKEWNFQGYVVSDQGAIGKENH